MMTNQFEIEWVDLGREPQEKSNPDYPNGIDLHCLTRDAVDSCTTALPYPAKRCGYYTVHCISCGIHVAATTAGRPDDPRSITIGCRTSRKMAHV